MNVTTYGHTYFGVAPPTMMGIIVGVYAASVTLAAAVLYHRRQEHPWGSAGGFGLIPSSLLASAAILAGVQEHTSRDVEWVEENPELARQLHWCATKESVKLAAEEQYGIRVERIKWNRMESLCPGKGSRWEAVLVTKQGYQAQGVIKFTSSPKHSGQRAVIVGR